MNELLNDFKVLRLKLRFRLKSAGILPAYKGSMLHGLMGQGLMHLDSRLYHALYHQHDAQQPKAYSFVCGDTTEHPKAGYILSFELRLFGDAIQCSHALIESLQYAAQTFGVGPKRIKAQLISLSSVYGAQESVGITPFSLVEHWSKPYFSPKECGLELISPLRIKHRGAELRNAPPLSVLVNSIARRFNALCQFWYMDSNELTASILQNVPPLDHVECIDHTYWQEWQRYSKNSSSLCQFGGLQGMISYQGNIEQALPWLELGQYLQVGSKTTFGLGNYRLITPVPIC